MERMEFSSRAPMYDDESLCIGNPECCKCDTCARLRPKSDFNKSFFLKPPGHTKRCSAFKAIH